MVAMPKFTTMFQNERRFRALTGLDLATFTAFLPAFTAAMERYLTRYTLDGYVRESDRAITYANSPLPSPEDRLVFILIYLKQNPLQEAHGQLFAMTQSNVSKWVRLLLEILGRALVDQQVIPARTTAELAAQLQADTTPSDPEAPPFFCHDGTERPIARPNDDEEQEIYYSGKKKDHTIKNVIIIDATGAIRFLSATYAGRVHDKHIADESNYQLPEGSVLAQDSGFQGLILPGVTILQPKKKPPKGTLTDTEKEDNRWISHIRILIEHSIGGVKVYRIVRDVIRHWDSEIRDQVMEICCGLYNLRLHYQTTKTT
jgi:DDE superfamily endonuclease/Helix-turn-helix of DDE superfamily endonuclease